MRVHAEKHPPVTPPPEPEKKRPPIGPPKRDPKPEPIKDPIVPPSPESDPQEEPKPIGDPPDGTEQPIRMRVMMKVRGQCPPDYSLSSDRVSLFPVDHHRTICDLHTSRERSSL
jgi:hypothetical protein